MATPISHQRERNCGASPSSADWLETGEAFKKVDVQELRKKRREKERIREGFKKRTARKHTGR
jgi:hypothetical protein